MRKKRSSAVGVAPRQRPPHGLLDLSQIRNFNFRTEAGELPHRIEVGAAGVGIAEMTIEVYPRPDGVVASCGSCAIALVKVMRIPCFGCRMTIGRVSIVWPGASSSRIFGADRSGS